MTTGSDDHAVDGIALVSEPSLAFLNERQLVDYRSQRRKCLEWLLALGKTPDEGKGYAHGTVEPRSRRMDKFYRWVWAREGGYTADVTPDLADAWLHALAKEDTTRAHMANCQKAAQMLLKWRHHVHGIEEWEPAIRFTDSGGTTAPRDYLTREERTAVREAALSFIAGMHAPHRTCGDQAGATGVSAKDGGRLGE